MWFMMAPEIKFVPNDLEKQLANFQSAISKEPDMDSRFTLMSKLFTRAQALEPGEERFLWLWTVLEVFPMKDTSNIQPISDYLAQVISRAAPEIKSKLEI